MPMDSKQLKQYRSLADKMTKLITAELGHNRTKEGAELGHAETYIALSSLGSVSARLFNGLTQIKSPATVMTEETEWHRQMLEAILKNIPEAKRPKFDMQTGRWMDVLPFDAMNAKTEVAPQPKQTKKPADRKPAAKKKPSSKKGGKKK
jgi:hypothetical protein